MMKKIILATSNQGKIAELMTILSSWHCIPQSELSIGDADEIGLSFIENAIIKARHASRLGKKAALADDSGLVVQALDGAPGIYSARYAGPEANDRINTELLLANLAQVPVVDRQAYFYCAIVLVKYADDPTPIVATGKLDGIISQAPRGDRGFGYDPVFYIPSYGCTAAELSVEVKNRISHRAQALTQLLKQLEQCS